MTDAAPSKRTTKKKDPGERIIQEIIGGRADDQLLNIATAIAVRVRDTGVTFAWRFRLDGLDVGEYDLTPSEWETIESLLEQPWTTTNPDPKNGGTIRHTRIVTTVLLQSRGGLTGEEAIARFGELGLDDLQNLFASEQRDAPLSSPT